MGQSQGTSPASSGGSYKDREFWSAERGSPPLPPREGSVLDPAADPGAQGAWTAETQG